MYVWSHTHMCLYVCMFSSTRCFGTRGAARRVTLTLTIYVQAFSAIMRNKTTVTGRLSDHPLVWDFSFVPQSDALSRWSSNVIFSKSEYVHRTLIILSTFTRVFQLERIVSTLCVISVAPVVFDIHNRRIGLVYPIFLQRRSVRKKQKRLDRMAN